MSNAWFVQECVGLGNVPRVSSRVVDDSSPEHGRAGERAGRGMKEGDDGYPHQLQRAAVNCEVLRCATEECSSWGLQTFFRADRDAMVVRSFVGVL